jgi:Protein of unknown function (DUF2587)
MRAISGRRSLVAGNCGGEPGHMETAQDTISQWRDRDDAGAGTTLWRYAITVSDHVDDGPVFRVEDPARLLRVYWLLHETFEQIESFNLPPEGMPGLQRQLEVIRRETERTLSPPLAAELERVLPSHDAAPSAGALRIECAGLVSWVASLVVQMLNAVAAAQERSQQVSADRGQHLHGCGGLPAGQGAAGAGGAAAETRGARSRPSRPGDMPWTGRVVTPPRVIRGALPTARRQMPLQIQVWTTRVVTAETLDQVFD